MTDYPWSDLPAPAVPGQLELTAGPLCRHPDGTEHDATWVDDLPMTCDEWRTRGAVMRWVVLGDP